MAQLWGGRFTKETDKLVYAFNASIGFDKRLWQQDIEGSIAHVKMLVFERPSVRALQASVSSKLANAPRAVRYIRGKATTAAAKTPPSQCMTSGSPHSASKAPIG